MEALLNIDLRPIRALGLRYAVVSRSSRIDGFVYFEDQARDMATTNNRTMGDPNYCHAYDLTKLNNDTGLLEDARLIAEAM